MPTSDSSTSDLNLTELNRLERAATQGRQYRAHPKRHNPPYFLMRHKGESGHWEGIADYGAEWAEVEFSAAARDSLRPLLDLVDRMGEALRVAVPNLQTSTEWREDDPGYRQVDDAFAEYQRAKGEK